MKNIIINYTNRGKKVPKNSLAIKSQERTVVGAGKSLLCDPGPDLKQGKEQEKEGRR